MLARKLTQSLEYISGNSERPKSRQQPRTVITILLIKSSFTSNLDTINQTMLLRFMNNKHQNTFFFATRN